MFEPSQKTDSDALPPVDVTPVTPSIPRDVLRRFRIVSGQASFQIFQRIAIQIIGGRYDTGELRTENLLTVLNPSGIAIPAEGVTSRSPSIFGDLPLPETAELIEQRWMLVDPIANAYCSGTRNFEAVARHCRSEAEAAGGNDEVITARALKAFSLTLYSTDKISLESAFPDLHDARERFAGQPDPLNRMIRTLRFAYGATVLAGDIQGRAELQEVFAGAFQSATEIATTEDQLYRFLDSWYGRFRTSSDAVVRRLADTMRPTRLDYPDSFRTDDFAAESDHVSIREKVVALEAAFDAGQRSAVSGANAYPRTRIVRHALNALCIPKDDSSARFAVLVCFNGSHDEALRYTLGRFAASKPELRELGGPVATEMYGLYGAFPRTYLQFPDGSVALVVSSFGESRQISHAATLLLYTDPKGIRIRSERMWLAGSRKNEAEFARTDFEELMRVEHLAHEAAALINPSLSASLTNTLFVTRTVTDLIEELPASSVLRTSEGYAPSFGPCAFVYVRSQEGIQRFIAPSVGSSGLYGKGAGLFVENFLQLSTRYGEIDPVVHFTATAGGLGIAPGSLVSPIGDVVSGTITRERSHVVPSLVKEKNLEQLYKEAGVELYDLHWCVDAPAFETSHLIDQVTAAGAKVQDVELSWIIKSIQEARQRGVPAIFNGIYIVSDDPASGLTDPFAALGIQQVHHEGVGKDPKLFRLLVSLARR